MEPYTDSDQAILVGKVDCIIWSLFGDRRTDAKLQLFRLNPDGSTTYVNTITSEYSVLFIQPGIYGLSSTHFQVGALSKDRGYRAKGEPNHAPLFEPSFWQQTEIEQLAEIPKLAPDFFGILKVNANDVLYYGDLTLDTVTNQTMPMFVDSRNGLAAAQALRAITPSKVKYLKNAGFAGPPFLLGKIRKSRFQGSF